MGFFDKVKDFAEDAGRNVASTSKTLSAKADTKLKIAALNKEMEEARVNIRKTHEKIGEAFLNEYQNQIAMEDDLIINAINEINKNNDKISEAKLRILDEEEALKEKISDIERDKYED
ncbi:MAG: hypothetical protein ACRC28_04045 [Clostridium sp.]|uniref:hypothetical protein n=1 Tax=Clostridium sp. TaxID=1506 RepID=UPI003F32F3AC